MVPGKRVLTCIGLLVLGGAAITVAAPAASGTSPPVVKPVIGQPTTVPARAVAGKRLTVSYKVTRSDNGKALTAGRMMCDPSSSGKVIAHTESFRAGYARLSFVVPATATQVRVKVTIKSGVKSTTKISTFAVRQMPKPAVSIAGASVTEGNTGNATLSFPVTLSAASPQTVTVAFATSDGSATAPGDYAPANGTLTFKPGEKAKSVSVSVVGDTTVETDETLSVTLSGPVNATIATASATGTIKNDDVAPKSGHYAGSTAQGKAISFDVGADLAGLTTLQVVADLTCSEVPVMLRNFSATFPGPIPMTPTWGFTAHGSESDAAGALEVLVNGQLAVPANASGTLTVNFSVNMDDGSVVHCSSGAVTWTATTP
ncbi:MAG: Calx-beta domain-containing protein [Verrucomicrobiota bacterium]